MSLFLGMAAFLDPTMLSSPRCFAAFFHLCADWLRFRPLDPSWPMLIDLKGYQRIGLGVAGMELGNIFFYNQNGEFRRNTPASPENHPRFFSLWQKMAEH